MKSIAPPIFIETIFTSSKLSVESYLKELLDYCLNGNRQSCGKLLSVSEYRQRVEKIARKNTRGSPVFWEDAAQTAHLKVFQAAIAGKFRRGEVREFYRWAAKVARFEIIDLIRQQKYCNWTSLNENIPGTDVPLLETIPDMFNLLDAVERTDLLIRVIEVIEVLDRRYPQKGYLKLWQGKVQDKNQTQLAAELGITQGGISKRWQALSKLITEELAGSHRFLCLGSQ